MPRNTSSPTSRAALFLGVLANAVLGGCAVVSVAGTAVGVVSTGVGLAVDATVGAVKLTGKAVGATVDAVTPSGEPAR